MFVKPGKGLARYFISDNVSLSFFCQALKTIYINKFSNLP